MLKFGQFRGLLKEVVTLKGYHTKGSWFTRPDEVDTSHPHTHISSYKGHKIIKTHIKDDEENHVIYHAVNKHGKTTLSVLGKEKQHNNKSSTLVDLNLKSSLDNKLKAHHFYKHLITKHNVILAGDAQSEGGMKVWQRLKKMKGIKIHAQDERTHKYSHVDDVGDGETHHGYDDTPYDVPYSDHLRNHIRDKILIAHRK